jgi:hypothetical protein
MKVNFTHFTFMLLYIVIDFFLNNQPDAPVTKIYSVIKLYIFRASSLPIISCTACSSILTLFVSGRQKPA